MFKPNRHVDKFDVGNQHATRTHGSPPLGGGPQTTPFQHLRSGDQFGCPTQNCAVVRRLALECIAASSLKSHIHSDLYCTGQGLKGFLRRAAAISLVLSNLLLYGPGSCGFCYSSPGRSPVTPLHNSHSSLRMQHEVETNALYFCVHVFGGGTQDG